MTAAKKSPDRPTQVDKKPRVKRETVKDLDPKERGRQIRGGSWPPR